VAPRGGSDPRVRAGTRASQRSASAAEQPCLSDTERVCPGVTLAGNCSKTWRGFSESRWSQTDVVSLFSECLLQSSGVCSAAYGTLWEAELNRQRWDPAQELRDGEGGERGGGDDLRRSRGCVA